MNELTVEYLETLERVEKRIEYLEEKDLAARGEEHYDLSRRINCLRAEGYELRELTKQMIRGEQEKPHKEYHPWAKR